MSDLPTTLAPPAPRRVFPALASVLVALFVAAPPSVRPQIAGGAAGGELRGAATAGFKVVATVNGVSISDAEVRQRAQSTTSGPLTAEALHEARRELAEEVLLAGEARRLGLDLTTLQLRLQLEQMMGSPPDFEARAEAAGTTVEHEIELARRSTLAGLYLLHRVGVRNEWASRIPPDSYLARLVSVTPGELRELYKAERDRLGRPAAVAFEIYPCASETLAQAIVQGLEAGRAPTTIEPIRDVVAVAELGQRVDPAIAGFLRTAAPGHIHGPHPVGEGFTVTYLVDRDGGQTAPEFSEVQDQLEQLLRGRRLTIARQMVVRQLRENAVWWPLDLFEIRREPSSAARR